MSRKLYNVAKHFSQTGENTNITLDEKQQVFQENKTNSNYIPFQEKIAFFQDLHFMIKQLAFLKIRNTYMTE